MHWILHEGTERKAQMLSTCLTHNTVPRADSATNCVQYTTSIKYRYLIIIPLLKHAETELPSGPVHGSGKRHTSRCHVP